jgi:hypothetical protein
MDGGERPVISSKAVGSYRDEFRRCDPKSRTSSVKKIKMPSGLDEEAKFVRGAMVLSCLAPPGGLATSRGFGRHQAAGVRQILR